MTDQPRQLRNPHSGAPPVANPSRHLQLTGPVLSTAGISLVVGHDPAAASHRALTVAADLARRLHTHLHVVHVIGLGDYPVDSDLADWETPTAAALADQRDSVASQLAGQPDGWTYHAARGNPVTQLSRIADEHDALMIVVGTRGEGAGATVQRLFSSSVSHGLLHHQSRPVLVVPDLDHG